MNRTPAILGGIAAALLGGAVFGATTNTTPLAGSHEDLLQSLPQHPYAEPAASQLSSPARDSYPLRTADGVVPVGELAFRGRLRDEMAALEAELDAYVAPRFEPLRGVERAQDHARDAQLRIEAAHVQRLMEGITHHPMTGQRVQAEAAEPVSEVVSNNGATITVESSRGGSRVIAIAGQ